MTEGVARGAACETFRERFGRPPEIVVRAPGRVNLLGGHVDYNQGWVLPGAIDRAIWLAAARRPDVRLRASSLTFGGDEAVALDSPSLPPAAAGGSRETWLAYPLGVAWALHGAGYPVAGLDCVVASDLPAGAGVSSSAALEVAFLLAWTWAAGRPLDRMQAARLGQRVENEYLQVQSGIMDQFASLHGRDGRLLFLDCRHLDWEEVPVPAGLAVLVADSGVRRQLVSGGLNERRDECQQALQRLRERWPDLEALRDVGEEDLDSRTAGLPPRLQRRVRHVVGECGRVRRGAELLRRGVIDEFGGLMRLSHESSRDLYEVSIPELDTLAEAGWSTPGCYGARLTGAGFGGCVQALVDAARVADVESAMLEAFHSRFGERPVAFRCRIADGASWEEL